MMDQIKLLFNGMDFIDACVRVMFSPFIFLCVYFCSGKQLNDNETLLEKNIKAGSIVHMVLQLRGGY